MWKCCTSMQVTKDNLYEYRDIWAEESGATNQGSAEWSFGNGAVGFIGLPIDEGWEVEAMYFHADTFATNASIQVDLMNYGNVASNASANTIASITLNNSSDGGGTTNNAYKYEKYLTPINIPVNGNSTVLGFITRVETGNISDARVGAKLRRKVGEYVSGVRSSNKCGSSSSSTLILRDNSSGNQELIFNGSSIGEIDCCSKLQSQTQYFDSPESDPANTVYSGVIVDDLDFGFRKVNDFFYAATVTNNTGSPIDVQYSTHAFGAVNQVSEGTATLNNGQFIEPDLDNATFWSTRETLEATVVVDEVSVYVVKWIAIPIAGVKRVFISVEKII